jgi:hypothetical protein
LSYWICKHEIIDKTRISWQQQRSIRGSLGSLWTSCPMKHRSCNSEASHVYCINLLIVPALNLVTLCPNSHSNESYYIPR